MTAGHETTTCAMAEVDSASFDPRHGQDEPEMDMEGHVDFSLNGSSKKRKRNRKIQSEKRFECKHDGCGKSYSRAEHLYRHQLNHTPKQIFRCDFPDCYRSFVRQDLCVRHRERHTTRGSQLQKRDSFANTAPRSTGDLEEHAESQTGHHAATTASAAAQPISPPGSTPSASSVSHSTGGRLDAMTPRHHHQHQHHHQHHPDRNNRHSIAAIPPMSMKPYYHALAAQGSGVDASDASFAYPHTDGKHARALQSPSTQDTTPFSPAEMPRPYGGALGAHRPSDASMSSPGLVQDAPLRQSLTSAAAAAAVSPTTSRMLNPTGSTYPLSTDISGASLITPAPYLQQQGLQMGLPGNGYSDLPLGESVATSLDNDPGLGGALDGVSGVVASGSAVGDPAFDPLTGCAYPIFGGETYNRSPFAMADDFAAWLFNEPLPTSSSSVGPYPSGSGVMPNYFDPMQLQNQFYISEPAHSTFFANVIPQHPMSVTSLLDPGSPQAIISEDKRQELLHLMTTRFNEAAYSAVTKRKDTLMDGDLDDDHHVLSLRMMQTYIGSYWYGFHPQLPILHQPTFAADKTPSLLLLAVMAIGAATLDQMHGPAVTAAAADLANFIGWHLRWEIFMDADFRPPAKLWVFQALLLLEVYEKMYSTRALHERAHIHHDTTLTLMRRGSSLIGRSSFDSPASMREARSATGSTGTSDFAADESWSHWIKAEATRRVAFAAFVVDSTHATMFGHSAKMVAHELRLPLPCDEALWSATSAGEVARVQSSLQANGIKPTMFLDGLKKTLNGQRVRTNAFGRTILMAGLLSVSWHMNQRDLQVSSLGAAQTLGGRDKWRASLLRAFDHWRRDVDEALAQTTGRPIGSSYPLPSQLYRPGHPLDEDAVAESRDVLHGLAHMASHVDIVDCQIFAGAGRLMGRFITPKDYSTAREKMTERWATKASARDATFHALRFLSACLLRDRSDGQGHAEGDDYHQQQHQHQHHRHGDTTSTEPEFYVARDDHLLNRPWVLYVAALVVWCYGYALDGPLTSPPVLSTPTDQHRDMRAFLRRVGAVRLPNELETTRGRNECLGLLMVLRDGFVGSRWELLGEAANLLSSCIAKLTAASAVRKGS